MHLSKVPQRHKLGSFLRVNMSLLLKSTLLILAALHAIQAAPQAPCNKASATKVTGSRAPKGQICPGQLILNEQFNNLDQGLWRHDATRGGATNGEFQWYVNDRSISFVRNGAFYIKPKANAGDGAVRSAKVTSAGNFAYKYGRIEVRGQVPVGDWLWPAFWHMPQNSVYGGWPRSGEIDLMESWGNRATKGPNKVLQTLHWGPNPGQNRFSLTGWSRTNGGGYNNGFHLWQMEWTPNYIKFSLDGSQTGIVNAGNGFWAKGGFGGQNIWAKGSKMAPFDQEFFMIINTAVGGTNGYWADNIAGKPWKNGQGYPSAAGSFWAARNKWLPTWNLAGDTAALKIDYVKIWAI